MAAGSLSGSPGDSMQMKKNVIATGTSIMPARYIGREARIPISRRIISMKLRMWRKGGMKDVTYVTYVTYVD